MLVQEIRVATHGSWLSFKRVLVANTANYIFISGLFFSFFTNFVKIAKVLEESTTRS